MNSIRNRAMEMVNNDLIYAYGYSGGEQSPPPIIVTTIREILQSIKIKCNIYLIFRRM